MVIATVGVAGALVLGVGAWYSGRPPMPPPQTSPVTVTASAAPVTTVAALTVYVTGEVVAPGLVSVIEGSRVADAIAAAGGATASAVLSSLNLAAPIGDGMQIVVPSVADPSLPDGAAEPPADGRVAVNRATAEELERLPGVGPVLAERIVEYRDAFGPFGAVEDLLDVPGIGEQKLASIRDAVAIP